MEHSDRNHELSFATQQPVAINTNSPSSYGMNPHSQAYGQKSQNLDMQFQIIPQYQRSVGKKQPGSKIQVMTGANKQNGNWMDPASDTQQNWV